MKTRRSLAGACLVPWQLHRQPRALPAAECSRAPPPRSPPGFSPPPGISAQPQPQSQETLENIQWAMSAQLSLPGQLWEPKSPGPGSMPLILPSPLSLPVPDTLAIQPSDATSSILSLDFIPNLLYLPGQPTRASPSHLTPSHTSHSLRHLIYYGSPTRHVHLYRQGQI